MLFFFIYLLAVTFLMYSRKIYSISDYLCLKMTKNGTYILKYKINDIENELIVEVNIRQIKGMSKPMQNIWKGYAKVNDEPYVYDNLNYCVNAKYIAEEIGLIERNKLKDKYKKKMKVMKQIIK